MRPERPPRAAPARRARPRPRAAPARPRRRPPRGAAAARAPGGAGPAGGGSRPPLRAGRAGGGGGSRIQTGGPGSRWYRLRTDGPVSDGRAGFRRYRVPGPAVAESDRGCGWAGFGGTVPGPIGGRVRTVLGSDGLGPYADVLGRPASGSGSWVGSDGRYRVLRAGRVRPDVLGCRGPWPGRAKPLCALTTRARSARPEASPG